MTAAASARFRATAHGRAARAADAATPRAKATRARYQRTPEYRARKRAAYWATPEGRASHLAAMKKYAATPGGKAKLRASHKAHAARGIDRLVEAKSGPCVDCGGKFPRECMDLDHVRGVKARGVGSMTTASHAAFWAEVAKCDLVCANCHRIRTRARLKSQSDSV